MSFAVGISEKHRDWKMTWSIESLLSKHKVLSSATQPHVKASAVVHVWDPKHSGALQLTGSGLSKKLYLKKQGEKKPKKLPSITL